MRRRLFFVRRFPVVYWLCAAALAAVTGLTVARAVGTAEASAARYGSLVRVPVVLRSVDAGAVLRAGDVEERVVPRALLPAGPVARSPVGRVALVPLVPGDVVLAARVAPSGLRGIAALLPEGARALSVPVGPGTPPLEVGDHVDVLASLEPSDDPKAGPPTFAVALDAPVLAVGRDGEKSVTVAVSPEDAPRVAFAVTQGAVVLALTSPAP